MDDIIVKGIVYEPVLGDNCRECDLDGGFGKTCIADIEKVWRSCTSPAKIYKRSNNKTRIFKINEILD